MRSATDVREVQVSERPAGAMMTQRFFLKIAELGGDLRDFLDFGRLVSHIIYTSCYVSGGKSKMLRGEVQDAGGSLRFLPESAPAKTPPEKHLRLEQKGRPSNHSNDFLLTLMCCTFNIS